MKERLVIGFIPRKYNNEDINIIAVIVIAMIILLCFMLPISHTPSCVNETIEVTVTFSERPRKVA